MGKVTLVFAGLLVLLGVGAYVLSGMKSVTALIPAFAGVILGACGALAVAKPGVRKHAMHAAVVVAALGLLAAAPGVPKVVQLLTSGVRTMTPEERTAAGLKDEQAMLNNGTILRPTAAKVQSAMAGVLLPYLVLSVKSFVDARRARATVA